MLKAPVNKIIPFSLVDGPGSRCAIFFQGCGFHCAYCHNPETIRLCVNCGACVSVCPAGALSLADGMVRWAEEKCCACDACLQTCPNSASPRVNMLTVPELMERLKPNLPFIRGITVSGGECTRQHEFITELFREVKAKGKTAFCDTNGERSFREMPELTDIMDKAMLDVKAFDDETHLRLTGRGSASVLENLVYLGGLNKLYEVRTVIVPGFLPNEQTVDEVSRILKDFPECRYKLIRFRTFGVRGALKENESPQDEYLDSLEAIARGNGVKNVVRSL